MRRHYANYFKGLPDVKEFRMRLTNTMNYEELQEIFSDLYQKYKGFEYLGVVAQ